MQVNTVREKIQDASSRSQKDLNPHQVLKTKTDDTPGTLVLSVETCPLAWRRHQLPSGLAGQTYTRG